MWVPHQCKALPRQLFLSRQRHGINRHHKAICRLTIKFQVHRKHTSKERSKGLKYSVPIFIMETQVIIVVSKKLKKHVYKRKPETAQILSPAQEIQLEEDMAAEVFNQNELLDKEPLDVECIEDTSAAIENAFDIEEYIEPDVSPAPSNESVEIKEEAPSAKEKKKIGLFKKKETKEKKEKKKKPASALPKKKERKSEAKISLKKKPGQKDTKSKAVIKEQFQKSEKVKKKSQKFSIFEPVEKQETFEEKIKGVLNEDGYYDIIPPADNGMSSKTKKKRDMKQIGLIAALVVVATLLIASLIGEFGGIVG